MCSPAQCPQAGHPGLSLALLAAWQALERALERDPPQGPAPTIPSLETVCDLGWGMAPSPAMILPRPQAWRAGSTGQGQCRLLSTDGGRTRDRGRAVMLWGLSPLTNQGAESRADLQTAVLLFQPEKGNWSCCRHWPSESPRRGPRLNSNAAAALGAGSEICL